MYYTVRVIHTWFVIKCSLQRDADQIVVTVAADELTAVCAVCSGRVGASVTHQISIGFGEQRGGKHTCR